VVGVTRTIHALLVSLLVLVTMASGQRVRMPTALPVNDASSTATGSPPGTLPSSSAQTAVTYAPTTSSPYTPPSSYASAAGTNGGVAGSYSQPPSTYGQPNTFVPANNGYTTSPPGSYVPSPSATSPLAPSAAFQNNIQAGPVWDPYGLPGTQQPTLLPQDPYLPATPSLPAYSGGTIATMTRLMQEARLDQVFIPGTASNELGVESLDLSATFAIPFFYNTQTPLLVTPGFAMHFWNGPETLPGVAGYLPARTYDAYLDASWNPQLSPVIGAELGVRMGVYSDFEKVVDQSVRFQGHGLAVLALSSAFQLKAGVVYLDRVHLKLLPAGGIVWTPNPDVRFEILFPNPRIARRLWTCGNTDWWLYLRGEYGGGSWTVKQDVTIPVADSYVDQIDYNDIRAGLGLEFDTPRAWKGLFEVGVTCEREVIFRTGNVGTFRPDPTVYLRAALAY